MIAIWPGVRVRDGASRCDAGSAAARRLAGAAIPWWVMAIVNPQLGGEKWEDKTGGGTIDSVVD